MTGYPEVLDYSPLHVDAAKLHKLCQRFGVYADRVEKVGLAVAGHADGTGVAFPSIKLIARLSGETEAAADQYVHWLQAAGFFIIRKAKAEGAKHAHNVYKIAKSFIHRTADITSAHFIGNLQNWKAKAEDVAAAVKEKARAAMDTVVEQAGKLAAVFQEKPELMESPERAAEIAGIAETPESTEALEEPVTVELPAVAEPIPSETVQWDGAPESSTAPMEPVGDMLDITQTTEPIQAAAPVPSCYKRESSRVFASWRDRVAAYRKETATV